jgi:xylulokinase
MSKGTVLGLTFRTTASDFVKALLEGLTFELRQNLDLLRRAEVLITELRAIGGGARSAAWLQLKADITGIPVVVPATTEAACWGAAILAGVASGQFRDPAEGATAPLQIKRRVEPQPERYKRYTERYQLYQEIYPAIAPILARL